MLPDGAFVPLPAPNRLYGIATHALIELWDEVLGPDRTLHVPAYFCPEVVQAWRRHGLPVVEYPDGPDRANPDWRRLRPGPRDAVLAVNFFGARGRAGWARWQRSHPGIVLVEDHSHDPGSRWARESTADYAMASLRKTMPVSDGAILWSPRGSRLPGRPPPGPPSGSQMKQAAMDLKRDYLAGGAVDKEAFRGMQLRGERDLLDGRPASISSWSAALIERGIPVAWRRRRARNVRVLLELTKPATAFKPLFERWGRGGSPFSLVVTFDDADVREACRRELIGQGIYTPVHWLQPDDATSAVHDLASRILTIPTDQRYGLPDMRRVAAALLAFDRRTRTGAESGHSRSRGAR